MIVQDNSECEEQLSCEIPASQAGKRLDLALTALFPDFSRARLQKWIKSGHVLVDGLLKRPKDLVFGGELVEIDYQLEEETQWRAEAIALDIVYQDDSIIVVNKPVGLVVHPGAGNRHGTLSNALLYFAPELKNVPRAGIVHRLDKDTSGLLVVARTPRSHKQLVSALSERRVAREYLALVQGVMPSGGTVNANIGRHPKNRLRMAVIQNGKPAITHYLIQERYRHYTLVRVKLETGRTHQIRVHMAYIRHPLVGDLVYGGRLKLPAGSDSQFLQALREFRYQVLHAVQLGLEHPESGQWMQWQIPLPMDFEQLIVLARKDAKPNE